MNKVSFLSILTAVSAIFFSSLCKGEVSPAFTPPSGDPLAVLVVPDSVGAQNLSIAVSQALLAEDWKSLNWENNITTATTLTSRVKIKVFAVAGPADVKLFVAYSSERDLPEDRMKKVAAKELQALERAIAKKLNLDFHQAQGDETIDTATPRKPKN